MSDLLTIIELAEAPEIVITVVEEEPTVISIETVMLATGTGSGYEHTQTVASDIWTVSHNLGYKPAGIQLWDSAGSSWTGLIVEHVDTNTLRILLPFSFSGHSIHS